MRSSSSPLAGEEISQSEKNAKGILGEGYLNVVFLIKLFEILFRLQI
jgi:hypothetical protein